MILELDVHHWFYHWLVSEYPVFTRDKFRLFGFQGMPAESSREALKRTMLDAMQAAINILTKRDIGKKYQHLLRVIMVRKIAISGLIRLPRSILNPI